MEYILPFVPEKIKNYPTYMDFDGQGRAERYFQVIIISFAVIGFIWGYITQLFSQTMYILLVGVIISSLLTLIPWGMYRKQKLNWQPARNEDEDLVTKAGPVAKQSQINLRKKLKK